MIQRVQTIFLLIVSILMVCVLFFPLWQKKDISTGETATVTALNMSYSSATGDVIMERPTFYIAIAVVISALVALYSIFQYTDRLRQIKLGALNSFLIAVALFTSLYFCVKSEELLAQQIQGTYLPGFWAMAAAMISNYLANRFIRKDEKLVRSADRIR